MKVICNRLPFCLINWAVIASVGYTNGVSGNQSRPMQQRLVNRSVLVLVLIFISALFFKVIEPFLLSIFVAALFSALFSPFYRWILSYTGNRPALASLLTLLSLMLFVFTPLLLVFGTVLAQALDVAETALPWVQQQLAQPGLITEKLQQLPFYELLVPYREMALNWFGQITSIVSSWVIDSAQAATKGTIKALFSGLIILYTMFFFFMDGDRLLYYLLYYLPLNDDDEKKLLARFTSVTRATLKGTAVIGVLQGALAGLALYFAGIPSALFWAVAMMFLSVVPGIGTALVWGPAVIYLVTQGEYLTAVLLGAYCLVVVGSIDNLLRPKLVGNDTRLHELMIFFSTLGGLLLFGFMGFVIGPLIAALFVTIWELYGLEFSRWLPTTAFKPRSGSVALPHERMRDAIENTNDTASPTAGVEAYANEQLKPTNPELDAATADVRSTGGSDNTAGSSSIENNSKESGAQSGKKSSQRRKAKKRKR